MPERLSADGSKVDASQAFIVATCPLCRIPNEEILAEFKDWKLARTKTMKGHRERLMLFHKKHIASLDEGSVGEAYFLLSMVGSKFFSFTPKWAIFEPVYATVPDHWHRVASDLDPKADDHEQILKTPRMIVDNTNVTVARVEASIQEVDNQVHPSNQST